MRKLFTIFVSIIIIMFSLFSVSAHPGKTDSAGGHYNHDTGVYHYHHGYTAHDHPNGICPFEDTSTTSAMKEYEKLMSRLNRPKEEVEEELKQVKEELSVAEKKLSDSEKKNDYYLYAISALSVIVLILFVYVLYLIRKKNKPSNES